MFETGVMSLECSSDTRVASMNEAVKNDTNNKPRSVQIILSINSNKNGEQFQRENMIRELKESREKNYITLLFRSVTRDGKTCIFTNSYWLSFQVESIAATFYPPEKTLLTCLSY